MNQGVDSFLVPVPGSVARPLLGDSKILREKCGLDISEEQTEQINCLRRSQKARDKNEFGIIGAHNISISLS